MGIISFSDEMVDLQAGEPWLPEGRTTTAGPGIAHPLRGSILGGGLIPQQIAGAAPPRGGLVLRVVEGTMLKRQATTADAGAEFALHQLQGLDTPIEQPLPLTGYPLPVAAIRRAAIGQPCQRLCNLAEAQPHPLCHPDKGDAAQRVPWIETLTSVAAKALDQPLFLVKTQGTGVDTGTLGYLAYGQPFAIHLSP